MILTETEKTLVYTTRIYRGEEHKFLDLSLIEAVREKKAPDETLLDKEKKQGIHGVYFLNDGTIYLNTRHYCDPKYFDEMDLLFSQGKYETYMLRDGLMISYK